MITAESLERVTRFDGGELPVTPVYLGLPTDRRPALVHCAGLGSGLWAGSVAAVQRLLVQEGTTAPGVVCDESGWLAESGDRCAVCGRPTPQTSDVIDELAQAVIDTGGSVEHVAADTPLKADLAAAHLRFPLPPPWSCG